MNQTNQQESTTGADFTLPCEKRFRDDMHTYLDRLRLAGSVVSWEETRHGRQVRFRVEVAGTARTAYVQRVVERRLEDLRAEYRDRVRQGARRVGVILGHLLTMALICAAIVFLTQLLNHRVVLEIK